jgi:hypothetical protein
LAEEDITEIPDGLSTFFPILVQDSVIKTL